jgi:hypothetical protein
MRTIVSILKVTNGPVDFDAMDPSFEGTSGPIKPVGFQLSRHRHRFSFPVGKCLAASITPRGRFESIDFWRKRTMNIWTARIGSILYISTLALLVGVIAHGRAEAQAPGSYECAKEGERCAFTGTAEVAYGVGTKWAKKVVTSSIQCGVASFGYDPAPNEHKTCVISVTKCADEGGKCAFSGVRTVKYGANNTWAVKTLKDGITCGVAAFGYDPVPNVRKQCFLSPVPNEKPINQITWLGTHNAIAAPYYGIATMASQRDSVTAQLDRGARALEIDTVYDDPSFGYTAGVYVCHCGAAPHSTSLVENNRFASGKENQTSWPFELSGWTHPIPFTRFSTILQEIDRWMIANPGEIVIILMENNSANSTQLDTEIEAAGLKTGIYQKGNDNNPWPTKSTLVRQNKRLILQVSDDKVQALGFRGEKDFSKYASAKYMRVYNANTQKWDVGELIQYGALTPPGIYGNLNEYANHADNARTYNQLFVMGAFNSALTDEITAGAHNKYAFLAASKAQWNDLRPANTFYPSIIEVNQIHVGDALRFVNDINGTDYLVSSRHDTVGDTSGNSWQIRFENTSAGLNGGIVVMYWEDDANGTPLPKIVNPGRVDLSTGVARMINIPRNTSPGKPITVSVMMYSTSNFEVYSENIPADFTGSPVPCFALTGHLAAPKGGRCSG